MSASGLGRLLSSNLCPARFLRLRYPLPCSGTELPSCPRLIRLLSRSGIAQFLKRADVAEWVALFGGLVGTAPAPLQALVGPMASLLPITPFNMVCTNLRGPDAPLYLLGHKMLDWYPYVPVGGEMALNCAILSYNGVTHFGFSGDVHAAPDLHTLETLLTRSLVELQHATGVEPPENAARVRLRPNRRRAAPTPPEIRNDSAIRLSTTATPAQQPAVAQARAAAAQPQPETTMVAAD